MYYQVLTVNVASLFWSAFVSFQANRKDLTPKSPMMPIEEPELPQQPQEEKKEEV